MTALEELHEEVLEVEVVEVGEVKKEVKEEVNITLLDDRPEEVLEEVNMTLLDDRPEEGLEEVLDEVLDEVNMTLLEDLPEEVLEEVYHHLPLLSCLALACTSSQLQRVLCRPSQWRALLHRTRLDQKQVQLLVEFLSSAPCPSPLSSALHSEVVSQQAATEFDGVFDSVMVTCNFLPKSHSVTRAGLQQLELLGDHHSVSSVHAPSLSPALLQLVASRVQGQGLQELSVDTLTLRDEEEASSWASLLQGSHVWYVRWLELEGEAGARAWAGVARAAGGGEVGVLYCDLAVLARGGVEELYKVWGATQWRWEVEGRDLWRWGRRQEGWGELEELVLQHNRQQTGGRERSKSAA